MIYYVHPTVFKVFLLTLINVQFSDQLLKSRVHIPHLK